jgi:SAM-dependent methyltransferase
LSAQNGLGETDQHISSVSVSLLDGVDFDRLFEQLRLLTWQETPEYYLRYRTRYEAVLHEYAKFRSRDQHRILEIGGGQLATMAHWIWGDVATVADLSDTCFDSLAQEGVDTFLWNLARDDAPTDTLFDVIFFSEVIEHLPVPGHVALRRLKDRLDHRGMLIMTTPNLYRLRNIVFLATGRRIFDYFDLPGDAGFGHVLEYSSEHLDWQLRRAGFDDFTISLREFHHAPVRRLDRCASTLGRPLRLLPRLRDNLLAIAYAP